MSLNNAVYTPMSIKETNVIKAQQSTSQFKHFTIGREWNTSQTGDRLGAIRISNTLPAPVVLEPGTMLFRFPNVKREGKNDADTLISILLPVDEANANIAAEKALRAARMPKAV